MRRRGLPTIAALLVGCTSAATDTAPTTTQTPTVTVAPPETDGVPARFLADDVFWLDFPDGELGGTCWTLWVWTGVDWVDSGFLATSQIGDTPSKLSEPLSLFGCDSDPLWGPFAIEGFDRVPVESSAWIRFCDGSKGPCTIALQFP